MEGMFFVTAFAAEIIGTVAGFGSSTILLPVALLFFDFKTALVLVAFMHLFGNLSRIAFFRKGISWKVLGWFGAVGLAGTFAGALLVNHIDQEVLKAGLGLFLIGYGLFAFMRPTFSMKPSPPNMLIGGLSSGFMAGLIGTGGAMRSAFLTAYKLPKAQYIGTAAVIAVAVDGTRIPLYLRDGLLDPGYAWMLPVLFVLAVAGSLMGKRVVEMIPQTVFGKVVLVCLVIAGLKLVSDFIW